ncbi:hypothetical protein Pan216_54260 [Planctomycetes bacterium Pan216]|uniref:SH3 domain-containing protein n=1 Tax=Kolteria novifilia TaxID=2527975 RepID=A0A518BC30_9BACT|nr:hypothetical protein Pan216_54260 [Planctomycetes bacterium Pan216]
MRSWIVLGLMIALGTGCDTAMQAQREEEARRKATVKKLKQLGEKLHEQHTSFPSVLPFATEYYTTGPQQGRPADGTFPAGTKVRIIEKFGSYVLVKSEGGTPAYIAADAAKQPEGDTSTP